LRATSTEASFEAKKLDFVQKAPPRSWPSQILGHPSEPFQETNWKQSFWIEANFPLTNAGERQAITYSQSVQRNCRHNGPSM
jgi:hypothetical protein